MKIIIAIIWLILSIYAIYYVDNYYYWDNLFKIFIAMPIIMFLFHAWKIYDPNLNHSIATIEINPTWEQAILVSFIEGICITGPIAGLYILKEKIQERRG